MRVAVLPSRTMDTQSRPAIKLREYLDSRGIRYSWVAAQLGVDRAVITRLMNARQMTVVYDRALCQLFDEPLGTFLPVEVASDA